MNISTPKAPTLEGALASIPTIFRSRLVKFYGELKNAYVRGDFDACGSRAGKFTETLIRCLQNHLEGTHVPFGTQVNIAAEARRLESLPRTAGPEALRIFIPRALNFLYTLRNKRGFAHVGGDLDSERVDAQTCVRIADWCLCELIRIVHNLSLEDAQSLVDTISSKEVQDVWSVAGRKRVLRDGLSYRDKVLLLLYSEPSDIVLVEDLYEWVEYSRMADFQRRILTPLHKDRLVEWDRQSGTVILSPKGIQEVEEKVLILSSTT